jgi:hypothetical protein
MSSLTWAWQLHPSCALSTYSLTINKAGCLSNLGISYLTLFELLGEPNDLDMAIASQQQAVDVTPDCCPAKGHTMCPGDCLHIQERHQNDEASLARALSIYAQSARSEAPSEADELETIARVLESAVTVLRSGEAVQARRHHAEGYEHILEHIRSLLDFNGFLKPEKFASLGGAAISGPVVTVNAQKTRCDAPIPSPSLS